MRIDGSWLLTSSELDDDRRRDRRRSPSTSTPIRVARGTPSTSGTQHFDGEAAAAYATGLARVGAGAGAAGPLRGRARRTFAGDAAVEGRDPGHAGRAPSWPPGRSTPASSRAAGRDAGRGHGRRHRQHAAALHPGDGRRHHRDQPGRGRASSSVVRPGWAGRSCAESAEGPLRVLVQNGVGVPGLSEAARQRLLGARAALRRGRQRAVVRLRHHQGAGAHATRPPTGPVPSGSSRRSASRRRRSSSTRWAVRWPR